MVEFCSKYSALLPCQRKLRLAASIAVLSRSLDRGDGPLFGSPLSVMKIVLFPSSFSKVAKACDHKAVDLFSAPSLSLPLIRTVEKARFLH